MRIRSLHSEPMHLDYWAYTRQLRLRESQPTLRLRVTRWANEGRFEFALWMFVSFACGVLADVVLR